MGGNMRLRNKKTGEIVERSSIVTLRYKISSSSSSLVEAEEFGSIEQLNEEWEDYEPKEPLIKDEKIRKAVRVWLEYCHVQLVNHYLCDGNSCFTFTDEGGNDCSLDFTFRIGNLESNTDYTITELCGEEE